MTLDSMPPWAQATQQPAARPHLAPGAQPPIEGPPGSATAPTALRHHQLLRAPDGPPLRWWRPAVSIVTAVATYGAWSLLVGLVIGFVVGLTGGDAQAAVTGAGPAQFLMINLVLAGGVLMAVLATRLGFGRRPRWISSVRGGLRRGWLAWCLLGVVGAYLITFVVALVIVLGVVLASGAGQDAAGSGGSPTTPDGAWPALLAIMLLTTPLQVAGEEYVFRGWIPQLIGAVVRGPRASALIAGAVSTTLFALAHGRQDLWLFGDRFLLGAVAFWLAWRTGGLEAGIALHVVKNFLAFGLSIAMGGQSGLTGTMTRTEGSLVPFLLGQIPLLLAVGLILLLARWRRPATVRTPEPPAVSPEAGSAPYSQTPPAAAPAPWPPAPPAPPYLPPTG